MANLIEFTNKGLYVPVADVYIDPWRAVPKAFITHGHSDHARYGHGWYATHRNNVPIIRHRLGADINVTSLEFGEVMSINGVSFSLHPAGHVLGSSQVRVEYKGEVWVFSGDYKVEDDGISGAFEPIKCHAFITESTFGLPVFNWKPQADLFTEVNRWWQKNKEEGKVSLLNGYSLGKAQRLIANVDSSIGPIYTHGAVEEITSIYRSEGITLPPTTRVNPDIPKNDYQGALIIAPSSANGTPWANKFKPLSIGVASGWMNLRGAKRWQAADRGFPISDHADWHGLISAIKETGADKIFVTHGYTSVFTRWLREQGYDAHEVHTLYGDEKDEGADEIIKAEEVIDDSNESKDNPNFIDTREKN